MTRRTPKLSQPGKRKTARTSSRAAPRITPRTRDDRDDPLDDLLAAPSRHRSNRDTMGPHLNAPGSKSRSKQKKPVLRAIGHDDPAPRSRSRRKNRQSLRHRLFWALFRIGLVLGVWGIIIGAGVVAWIASDLPDIRKQNVLERRPSIMIMAADNTPLMRYGDLHTGTIDARDLPPDLVNAVLAVEDRRFYHHIGVDFIGLARAIWINYHAGRVVQGGSTLTQQLAKNLFLTPERTLKRKAQEALLALWLEQRYTKNQILTAYLNRVYLGAGTYGVDAAARTYFDKSARDVTLGEAAILAGLLKAPSRYSPATSPDLAWKRAQIVLSTMEDAGFINSKQRQNLESSPRPQAIPAPDDSRRYYADWIAGQVAGLIGTIDRDLVVHTSFDAHIQSYAEQAIKAAIAENGTKNRVSQGAALVMQPDGTVLAMVGGVDYDDSQFNRAAESLRQPGSSFKPIVYLAAMERGMRPDSMVEDAPINIRGWKPENYTNKYEGTVSLTTALSKSLNTASVRVMQYAGIENVRNLAQRLGIAHPLGHDLSLALGTSEVTMLEMAGAYAVFANGGKAVTPHGVTDILDTNGNVLYRYQAHNDAPQIIDPYLNAALVSMLRNVVENGTGTSARLPDRVVAGKTGTSQNYRDAWFIGFTGELLAAVWVGNDNNLPMHKITGGVLPAKIWSRIMQPVLTGQPVTPLPSTGQFAPPATVAASQESAPTPEEDAAKRSAFDNLLDRLLGSGTSDNSASDNAGPQQYPDEYSEDHQD